LSRLRVVPIVEGQGEDNSVRTLLERVWYELLGGEYIEVLKALRGKRLKLVNEQELERALDLAVSKLRAKHSDDPTMVLILLDADSDLPCILGPQLLARARDLRSDADISCVIVNEEYETWFVAAAESLTAFMDLARGPAVPEDPERTHQRKKWVQDRFRGIRYKPAADQPRMTQAMNLALCRQRSPSFDKLCRELEARLERSTHDHPS
jgi:Domain of unknown function (DUF4276)